MIQWYAIFGDGEGRPIIHRLLRRGFQHVDCFGFAPDMGIWIVYQFNFEGIEVDLLKEGDPGLPAWVASYPGGGVVLRVPQPAEPYRSKPALWKPMTCVTAVIEITRFPSSALTPHGLFRDLVRARAERAFERATDGEETAAGSGPGRD